MDGAIRATPEHADGRGHGRPGTVFCARLRAGSAEPRPPEPPGRSHTDQGEPQSENANANANRRTARAFRHHPRYVSENRLARKEHGERDHQIAIATALRGDCLVESGSQSGSRQARLASATNFTGPWRYDRLDSLGHWLQLEVPDQRAAGPPRS